MKILLTGFDPFGGEPVNPALEAVKLVRIDDPDLEIIKLEVPTVFGDSVATVVAAVAQHKPDAVVCVGQAGGRFAVTPERVAINISDARIPDNAGNKPLDEPILPDGPAAYFSTLPVKAMVAAIREAGIPASLSNSAGVYVCNHLMYGVLHAAATRFPGMRAGFIHVPYIPEQAARKGGNVPSMSLETIARGLEAALRAVRDHGTDIAMHDGKEH